ncbi:MAG: PQQ-dependent sugar dehydrogenase, partial [Luteolibacter sp.]
MSSSSFLALAAFAFLGTCGIAGAQTYGLAARPTVGTYFDSALPPVPPAEATNWSAVNAFPSLTFQNPMGLGPLPGTNKLLVWEREGRTWLIDPTTSAKTLSIDLSDKCQGWDDSGLFAVVPHPDFATNHYVFVYYTYVTSGMVAGSATARPPGQPLLPASHDPRNRLSRFTLDANGVAIPNSEFVLINQSITKTYHKGGGMFFHPTSRLLYLTV